MSFSYTNALTTGPAPTCSDKVQNQGETGVDCGGPCAACLTCFDGIRNGAETGVDCGGPCAACSACSDGIQNQGETGVDCGGPCKACPTCSDGIQNQSEAGIDCGGPCRAACATCSDGIKNGAETGVDCGGPCAACPTCSDGIRNQGEVGVDCGGPCSACPTCSDGIRNGAETGVDCGGPCAACPPPTATATTPKAPTKIVYAHVQGLTLSQLLRTVGTRRLYYGTAKAVIVDSANKPIAGVKVSFKFVHILTKTPADLPVVASATTTYAANAGIGSVSIDRSLWVCVTGITSLSTTATTRVYYVPSKNTVTCVSARGLMTKTLVSG